MPPPATTPSKPAPCRLSFWPPHPSPSGVGRSILFCHLSDFCVKVNMHINAPYTAPFPAPAIDKAPRLPYTLPRQPPPESVVSDNHPQITRLSHRHEAVLRAMLENPDARLGDIAALLGYTPAWLSTLIHTDAFRAELKKRQGELWEESSISIRERLTGLAEAGLDVLGERLADAETPTREVRETTQMALAGLGYSGGGGAAAGGQTVNVINVPSEVFQRARSRVLEGRATVVEESAE